jgi:hypothetical protein
LCHQHNDTTKKQLTAPPTKQLTAAAQKKQTTAEQKLKSRLVRLDASQDKTRDNRAKG